MLPNILAILAIRSSKGLLQNYPFCKPAMYFHRQNDWQIMAPVINCGILLYFSDEIEAIWRS
jgi:hypothetical protein